MHYYSKWIIQRGRSRPRPIESGYLRCPQGTIELDNYRDWTLPETEYISSDAPFGQGDIIQLGKRPRPPHLGVVINADCDLLHHKTDGVCSYLPIYSFEEYLLEFWIDQFLESQKHQILTQIAQTIDQPTTELDTLKIWLESDDHAAIPDRLTEELELKPKAQSTLTKLVERYTATFSSEKLPIQNFETLCRAQKNPINFARNQLTAACKDMGEGHLFINEIYGHSQLGYVVRLRRIYSIQSTNYYRSEYELLKTPSSHIDCALRIARLTTLMRSRLIQLFVHHFARVGLPDEINDFRQLIVDDVATTFMGEPR